MCVTVIDLLIVVVVLLSKYIILIFNLEASSIVSPKHKVFFNSDSLNPNVNKPRSREREIENFFNKKKI